MFRKSSVKKEPIVPQPEDDGRHPFFARKKTVDSTPTSPNSSNGSKLFRSRNNSDDVPTTNGTGSSSGSHLFSKHDSLSSARTKLQAAIAAEKAADEALIASRSAVKEAKLEISRLEAEAKEEAKAAQAKVATATKFRKAGDKLGKH